MIKNYEYGLLPPTENEKLVDDQMRGAHRYYNALIEIERERRARVAAILTGHADTEALAASVIDLARQREEARLAILAARKATRDRSETDLMRQRVRNVAALLKKTRDELKIAKAAITDDPMIARAIGVADEQAADRVRKARAACNVYWGSYLLAEQAMDAAKKSKAPPKFRRWAGDGRISVQLQGGLPLADAWGTDTQLRIDPVSPDAHDPAVALGVRRLARRTTLHLRAQSDERGRPIWASWPMILHRSIPDGATIKSATVIRRRRDCRRWDWRLLLTIDVPDGADKRPVPAGGAVALNLGWCQVPGAAVRAGYLVGTNEIERYLVVTDGLATSAPGCLEIEREVQVLRSTIDRVEKSEAIRSQRDKDLDQMRDELVAWLRAQESRLPEWIVERTILARERPAQQSPGQQAREQPGAPGDGTVADSSARARVWHVAQWRSAARFRALTFAWRERRWDGDADGHEILEKWRYRDEHLERYETGMRRGGLADRRERYRILAAEMSQRYRYLVVDDFDLRTFQESPRPEDARVEIPAAKRNQRHASGSELRAALLNAFGPARVVRDRSQDVTRQCATCLHLDDWDHAAGREHACSACGARWDQDANACRNLLRRLRERLNAGDSPEAARAAKEASRKESRSQRLRRGLAEKRRVR